MAIKKREEKGSGQKLPLKIEKALKRAICFQQLAKQAQDWYEYERDDELKPALEASKDIEIYESEGLKTPYGTVTIQVRTNYEVDMDALEELIKKGKISLTTILQISKVSTAELQKILDQKAFNKITTKSESRSVSIRAKSDVKEAVYDVLEKVIEKATDAGIHRIEKTMRSKVYRHFHEKLEPKKYKNRP